MPLVVLLVVAMLGGLLSGREAHAACNLIPSASKTFRGALGATNRPFAAPGDFVEVAVDTARCDTGSSGFADDGADHVVTLVFEPTGGQARVVALTADSCSSGKMKSARLACEGTPGVGAGNVACVQVPPSDLAVVDRNGSRRLSFRFPDTDAFLAPDGDDRTLSGPATIAVTAAGAPLPCDLAAAGCTSQSGVVACVDDLYASDGTCEQVANGTFGHFTALPQANDYSSVCFADSPVPCNPTATELRIASDAAGNLLVPFNWEGILVNDSGIPVPRLMRATLRSPLGFSVPDSVFLGSFTPEGARLPPLFEPTADPSVASPDVITLFGSADAPYTILRVARHAGTCSNAAKTCVLDTDCPAGGTCPSTCVGGGTPGTSCASDAQCSGGRCGALFADFRPFVAGGGPLAVPRTPIGPGVCQLDPHASCNVPGDCAGVGNTCVAYAFEARTPVPLESLSAGTPDQFAFTVEERVDLADHNGDGDMTDSVITLRDRTTGRSQNLGAPAGCGIAGTPEGRAVVRINQPPFNFPAVAIEDDVLAFLESEPGENRCDEDGNGDASGAIARIFRLGTGEVAMSPVRGVDANLLVNGQSLAVSNGRVFFRSSEPVMGKRTTERVSLTPGGLGPNGDSSGNALSYDGRYVAFYSVASDLPNPNISPSCSSLYLRDRVAGTTEQLDPGAGGTTPRCVYFGGGSKSAEMSPDGRFVAFVSDNWNLEDPVFNAATSGTYAVHLRDRCISNGVAVGGGCVAGNTMVSVGPGGAYCALPPPPLSGLGTAAGPAVSDDGRFVAFSSNCTNFDPADTNDKDDVFVRDTCLSNGAPVPGCVATTERVSGLVGAADSGWTVDSGRIDMSADGRFVVFAGEQVFTQRVFLRDRLLGTTEIVNLDSQGAPVNNGFAENPQISADGRFVLFSTSVAFVAGDSNIFDDLYVRDRLLGTMERVNVGTDGAQGDSVTFFGRMSRDGRHVAFWSGSTTLLGPGGDTNAATDIFVRDRLVNVTRRVSVAYDGAQAATGSSYFFSDGFAISGDGQTVAFDNPDPNLLPPGADTNGRKDLFVRGVDAADPNGVDTLLFDNNRLTDSVLEVLDTGTNTLRTLCPATQAAVAGGMAAFLRPESAVGTLACPANSLNGDADVTDTVVDLWPGSGNPVSLGVAATAVAMSDTTIAALVSESGQNNTILNGDGDRSDAVVQVHPATVGGVWTNTAQAGDALQVCGPRAVFLTPEWQQGSVSLNPPDGDTTDSVLQIWDTSVVSGNLTSTQQEAEDFVCGPSLIALRTNEASQGADLNDDGDTSDDVLQVYDTTTSTLYNTHQAVTPCRLAQCDPRLPYRVFARSVKFLTVECDQQGSVVSGFCGSGGTDLNDDGDADDLVIQLFDVATDTTRTIGTVTGGNPLAGGDPTTGTGTAYVSAGACVETVGGKLQGVCVTDADCPPGSTCEPLAIVPASPDTDADGVPDHLDVCPRDADPGQVDGDGDGTGDACDAETCGNDVLEGAEACDGAAGGACPGSCQSDCACPCSNVVADAKAKVEVTTKKAAGKLTAKMVIPLGSYTGDPVVVRLDDGDSQPIALRSLVTLPPFGKSGKTWRFKSKVNGLQQVQLKSLAPKQPGMFQLIVNAKRWFTAGAANDTAASTRFTITVGGQCFTHVATKKTD